MHKHGMWRRAFEAVGAAAFAGLIVLEQGTSQSAVADSFAAGAAAPGSPPNQTLLVVTINNSATATAFVNTEKVGRFTRGHLPLDVSGYVRFGENKARLEWTGSPPQGAISVLYAVQPSQFRTIAKITIDSSTVKANEKKRALTFRLPKPK